MVGPASDAHEVRQFAADLLSAAGRVVRQTPPVIKRGAVNVKKQLVSEMRGSRHFRGAAPSIGFDVTDGGFGAEIGPESEPGEQIGDLASIAYFGGAFGGGGTVADPQGALDAEAPHVEKAIADLAGWV